MTTPKVILVKPEDIPDIWIDVKPLLEEALAHSVGELHTSDILRMLLNEKEFLWIGIDNNELQSVLIAEPIKYPRKQILRIVIWTVSKDSEFNKWIPYLYLIEDLGRTLNCTHLEAWARKGLVRKLKWDHEYSVISKPIKPKQQRKRRRRSKQNG